MAILTNFYKRPEFVARAKPLRPPPPRAIKKPVSVPRRTNNWWQVGTAFDYLLRFELKRQAPHCESRRWVAKSSLRLLFEHPQYADGICRSYIPDEYLVAIAPLVADDSLDDLGGSAILDCRQTPSGIVHTGFPIEPMPGEVFHELLPVAFKVGRRMLHFVKEAEAKYEAYIGRPEVSREHQEQMACCAMQLAKIDAVARTCTVDPKMFEPPDPSDIEDLVELLKIVPFGELLHPTTLILNPGFVGADADLISGDALIDVKVTVKTAIEAPLLDQLLGYFMLARFERRRNPRFPELRRLGLYYARHGALMTWPSSQWTEHPQFADVESWFVETCLKPMVNVAVNANGPTVN